ncbi:hypothetical protein ACIRQY_16745 [Streptomyces sp. NPDC101490]
MMYHPVLYTELHPVVPDVLRAAPDRPSFWRRLPTEPRTRTPANGGS